MEKKRALILLAEGFEELEAIAAIDVMDRGGITVTRASLTNGGPVRAAHGTIVSTDCSLDAAAAVWNIFDAIVLPGGSRGMENLRADERVIALLGKFADAGKTVAAICAAPLVLAKAGLLRDRHFTCYPGCEAEIADGDYGDDEPVVRDGSLITSRGPGTAVAFGLALVEALSGADAARRVAAGMLV